MRAKIDHEPQNLSKSPSDRWLGLMIATDPVTTPTEGIP